MALLNFPESDLLAGIDLVRSLQKPESPILVRAETDILFAWGLLLITRSIMCWSEKRNALGGAHCGDGRFLRRRFIGIDATCGNCPR